MFYPTHAAGARLNDEFVFTLLTMQFPPMPQLFDVVNVDEGGNPTIVTSGVIPKAPVQTELAQLRMSPEIAVQIASLMLQQVSDQYPEVFKEGIARHLPNLKDRL